MKRYEILVGDKLTWLHRWGPDAVEVLDTRLGWTMAGLRNEPALLDDKNLRGILVRVIATGYEVVVPAYKLAGWSL